MPITSKQKPGRGVPRKAGNEHRKGKFRRYLAKSTCYSCKLVFRSPKYKRSHDHSGHALTSGVNRRRSVSAI